MKLTVLVLAMALTLLAACKGDEPKQAPEAAQSAASSSTAVDDSALGRADCLTLRPTIATAQGQLAEKAHNAYSKKAFEDIATLRDGMAKEAAALKMQTDPAQKIAESWRRLNVRAAAAERRVGDSTVDAGPDASSAANDLMAIATDEETIFHDLDKLCPARESIPR